MAGETVNVKVGIGRPETGEVKAGTSFCDILAVNHFINNWNYGEATVEPIFVGGSMLPEQRNKVVALAIQKECTHLLWIDSDMFFPSDTISILMRHNRPIIGCNCTTRTLPAHPTCVKDGKKVYTTEESTGLEEVDHVGCGVLLTDIRLYKKVFDEVGPPFFEFITVEDDFRTQGEDVYFCQKVRKAGVPIYIDHDLSKCIKHIGEFHYHHGHAVKAKEMGVFTKEDLKNYDNGLRELNSVGEELDG